MKQKQTLLAILVAMAVFAFFQARGGLFGTREDVRSATFLGKVAAELNKQLPRAIDGETALTSVTGLDGVFVYNYRLVNRSTGEVDPANLVSTLKPQVTRAACAAPETRDKFLKQGITLRYSYADKAGQPVASFDVVPADCG
jgi:hypothetical protein